MRKYVYIQLIACLAAPLLIAPAVGQMSLYVDASSPPGGKGTSVDPFDNLQSALTEARAHVGAVEIYVAAGTYLPADPTGLRTSTFLIDRNDLVIRGGHGGGTSILSGDI